MCHMHPNSDDQLWNSFLTINSDSTHKKWMKFAFIVLYFSSIILSFGQRHSITPIKYTVSLSIMLQNIYAWKVKWTVSNYQ